MTISFKKIIKIIATWANDTQLDPELRIVFIFYESSLVFFLLRFKVKVTSLPTFQGPKVFKSIILKKISLTGPSHLRDNYKHFLIKSIDYPGVLNS